MPHLAFYLKKSGHTVALLFSYQGCRKAERVAKGEIQEKIPS